MDEILNSNDQTTQLDLSCQNITSLMQLVAGQPLIVLLTRLPNLLMIDLSSNKIQELFSKRAQIPDGILQNIQSFNISDNPIFDISSACEQISIMMPNLTDLQLSLFTEEDVDKVINKLPQLEYLNNLQVE